MWKVAVHRGRENSLMRIDVLAAVVVVVVVPMALSAMDPSALNQVVFREALRVLRTTIAATAGEGTVVVGTVAEAIRGEMMAAAAAEVAAAAAAAVVTASSRVVVVDVIRDAVEIPAGFVAAARFSLQRK